MVVSTPRSPSVDRATTLTFVDRRTQATASRLGELVERAASLQPDLEYFALHSARTTLPSGRTTPFRDLEASFAVADPPPPPQARLDPGFACSEAPRRLRRALDETLDQLLGDARRVAVLTGGGLDSGGLLALVDAWARRRERSVFAVAIDFEARGDDRPYLRALAERLRCEVVRVAPEEGARFVSTFHHGVDCAPMPWPNAAFELAAYARAKEAGADCVVTGMGGDALFDGEPRSLGDVLRAGHALSAVRSVRRLRGFARPRHPMLSWLVRPALTEGLLPRRLRARLARTAPVTVESWAGPAARTFLDRERRRRRDDLRDQLVGGHAFPSTFDLLFARHRQQIEEAVGIPRIDPFVDPPLQAFRRRLPPHWLLAGDIRRGLFREALRDLLPTVLLEREDKASFEPAFLRYIAVTGGFEALRRLARVPILASLGIIEPAPFLAKFEELAADPTSGVRWPPVWPVLALEAFARSQFSGDSRA